MHYSQTHKPDRTILGKFGETLAKEFLISQYYEIIGSNYYSRYGEIDLIAKHKNQTIFVEVKTRISNLYGTASESVSLQKINRLFKTIYKYFEQNPSNTHWRLDAITIQLSKDFYLESIEHYHNLSYSN